MRKALDRIIDANTNRLNEGLRVCEDICRFALSDRAGAVRFKSIRHRYAAALGILAGGRRRLIPARDSRADVGKRTVPAEASRPGMESVFTANICRCQEAMRVLEEMAKLKNAKTADSFKRMRFELYALEKRLIKRFQALRDTGPRGPGAAGYGPGGQGCVRRRRGYHTAAR